MRSRTLNALSIPVAAALALALNFMVLAHDGRTRLESRLTATSAEPLASGKAKFEMRDDRVRFSTEVQDVAVAQQIEVVVAGMSLGTVAIDALGGADLNLDSRDGDTVPVLQDGDLVEVFDTNGNILILSGTLGPD